MGKTPVAHYFMRGKMKVKQNRNWEMEASASNFNGKDLVMYRGNICWRESQEIHTWPQQPNYTPVAIGVNWWSLSIWPQWNIWRTPVDMLWLFPLG